ncbi:hypothetical protein [Ferrovibrio sp.]|uniref:hypothetical protein n=1 Tax=Ferrovibrio sp. TaxID=1917215 RepID=UPI0025BED46E|nr:hypothetical protein [Ferrovibrio sp.]MBX3455360.1 hypothetical protein [Ferrovibrio sp.]
MKKPQFINPPQDLRNKAVNFKTGVAVQLTEDIASKLEAAIAANGDTFAMEILDKLKTMRTTIAGVGPDSIARMFMLPAIGELAFEIKGMGGTFGYPLLTRLAKSLHDFIRGLSMPSDAQFEVIRIHVDAMYILLAQHVTGQGGASESEMLAMLNRAIDVVAEGG